MEPADDAGEGGDAGIAALGAQPPGPHFHDDRLQGGLGQLRGFGQVGLEPEQQLKRLRIPADRLLGDVGQPPPLLQKARKVLFE